MPKAYFLEISPLLQKSHIKAMIALRMSPELSNEMRLVDDSGRFYTVIKPKNYIGLLAEVVASLPVGRAIRNASVFTSADGSMVLDVFELQSDSPLQNTLWSSTQNQAILKDIKSCLFEDISNWKELSSKPWNSVGSDLILWLERCDSNYVLSTDPSAISLHFCMSQSIQSGSIVSFHKRAIPPTTSFLQTFSRSPSVLNEDSDPGILAFTAVMKPVVYEDMFLRTVNHLSRLGLDITKAKLHKLTPTVPVSELSSVVDENKGKIGIVTVYIRLTSELGGSVSPQEFSRIQAGLENDLKRLYWVDDRVLRVSKDLNLSIQDGEILTSISQMLHCILADEKPLVYTQYHIDKFLESYPDLAKKIIHLFQTRFSPPTTISLKSHLSSLEPFNQEIRKDIERLVELDDCKRFFHSALDLVDHVLKTNIRCPNRMGLSLRFVITHFPLHFPFLSRSIL